LVIHGENQWILKAQNSIQWHRNVFGWLTQHLKSPGPMAAQQSPPKLLSHGGLAGKG
jgi:hypothetical protein